MTQWRAIVSKTQQFREKVIARIREMLEPMEIPGGLSWVGYYTPLKGPYVGQALPASLTLFSFEGERAEARISVSHLFDDAEVTLRLQDMSVRGDVPHGPVTYTVVLDIRSVRLSFSHQPPALRIKGELQMNDTTLGELVLYAPFAQASKIWKSLENQ